MYRDLHGPVCDGVIHVSRRVGLGALTLIPNPKYVKPLIGHYMPEALAWGTVDLNAPCPKRSPNL